MKLCVVGIGGAGGKVTMEFMENEDLDSRLAASITKAEYITPGMIKGIWLEADKNDAKNLQHFFGDFNKGAYPGFFIPHDVIEDGSDLHVCVRERYGYDVKKQGFVRDAQYLKAIYEIFDTDSQIQELAAKEFSLNGAKDLMGDLEGVEQSCQKTEKIEETEKAENTEKTEPNGHSSFVKQSPNPIFDCAWNVIKPYTTLGGGDCDGILFIVSFGGGTGTGFINPIINNIRNEGKSDYPVFVLGILTETGSFADRAQNSKEGRRNLAAISALYDLLTKSNGANGVILVDNQILLELFENDYTAANRFIYKMMRPMILGRNYPGETPPSQAIAQNFTQGLLRPPIFVPLYATLPRGKNPEGELIRKALAEGKLFGCTPEDADFAVVFCRGFIDSDKIRQALSAQIGIDEDKIWVLRKMGEVDDEILIMLRNPYGGDAQAYTRQGTLENRFCEVISMALQYMDGNVEDLFYEGKDSRKNSDSGKDESVKLTERAKLALDKFYFGKNGFKRDNSDKTGGFVNELQEAERRLQNGEKPFFLYPMRIYQKEDKEPGDKEKFDNIRGKDEISMIIDKRVREILAEQGLIPKTG